jgi:ribosomal protein L37AE/L43A
MELDTLNPHQERVSRERAGQKTKFDYCATCQRYRWMRLENRQWVCSECGCPTEGV